jgi:hypothetical protein
LQIANYKFKNYKFKITPMPVRRMKTYIAQSGYVYQYYFVGKRPALAEDPDSPATEYIFDVTTGHDALYAISVFLREDAVRHWAGLHGRSLSDAEQYAASKLRLFQGFDEDEDLVEGDRRLAIGADQIGDLLGSLRLAE